MLTSAERDIRMGLWRIHILHHAAVREVWGAWLLEELAEHGHRLSPGTLYPALGRLERHGWLKRSGKAVHVRARQSYRITPAGRRVLESLRRDISQLYAEVVAGLEPRHRDALPREPGPDHRSNGGQGSASAARRSLTRKRP